MDKPPSQSGGIDSSASAELLRAIPGADGDFLAADPESQDR